MKVLQLLKAYAPAVFPTGTEQAHDLARELRTLGVDVRVVTTNGNGAQSIDVAVSRWTEHESVPVYYGRRIPGTVDLSWDTWRAFDRESPSADVIHVRGMFSWMNLAASAAGRRHGVPVIVSPRGMLNPEALAFSRWKKSIYFRLGGSRALDDVAAFHVTSEQERSNVAKLLPRARIAIVPNGAVIPSEEDLARWSRGRGEAPVALFVGRIHPIKNLIPLVEAWSTLLPRHPGAKLILAGPDDHGHRAEVERKIAGLEIGGSVFLSGYVGGEALSRLLATSTCLVLPSAAENFGNVVVEALAHRLPVIASTGTPWAALHDRGCGFWVPPTVASLADAVDAVLRMDPGAAEAMGERGRSWVLEEFSWSAVARGMTEVYRKTVSGG